MQLVLDPHMEHCCSVHGCRFHNNEKCTVFKGMVAQLHKCGESSICSEYRANYITEYDENPYSH